MRVYQRLIYLAWTQLWTPHWAAQLWLDFKGTRKGTVIKLERPICWGILAVVLAVAWRECAAQPSSAPSGAANPDAWLQSLLNLSANFETRVSYTPDIEFLKRIFPQHVDMVEKTSRGSRLREESFTILGDRAMFSSTQISGEPEGQLSAEAVKSIFVGTPERVERLSRFRHSLGPMGDISQADCFEVPGVLDLALGLRIYGHREWLEPDDVRKLPVEKTGDGCRVRLQDSEHSDEWDYKDAPQFHLASYTVRFGNYRVYQYVGDDFRVIGTVLLPFKVQMYYSQIEENGKPHIDETDELTVHDYSVGQQENTPARYQIMWPVGSRVEDLRIHKQIIIQSTTRPLDDKTIFSLLKQNELREHKAEADAQRRIDQALLEGGGTTRPTAAATKVDTGQP